MNRFLAYLKEKKRVKLLVAIAELRTRDEVLVAAARANERISRSMLNEIADCKAKLAGLEKRYEVMYGGGDGRSSLSDY